MMGFSLDRRCSVSLCFKPGSQMLKRQHSAFRAKTKETFNPPSASAGESFGNYGHVDIFVQAKVAEIKPK